MVGYSPWGRKGSDTTGRLHFHFKGHMKEIMLRVMVLKREHTSEAPKGLVELRVLGPFHPRVSDSVVGKVPVAGIWSEVTLGRSHIQSLER